MKPFRFSLIFAILSSLILLLLLTWFLLSLISFTTAENDLIYQKSEEGRILVASFVNLLPEMPLQKGSFSTAHRFVKRLSLEKNFGGITVVDEQGRVAYSFRDNYGIDPRLSAVLKDGRQSWTIRTKNGRLISSYFPIRSGGKITGAARITLSLQAEYERLNKSRHIFLAYFLLDSLMLLGFGSYLLSRLIRVPIRRLLAATEEIAAGDLSHKVSVPGVAEIADLADAFNYMVERLREKRDDAEQYVKSLEAMNQELQTARQEAIRSEKMASVGLLAAGTAHEIGTPLAAIMGYADILREELQNDPEKTDYLLRVEAESQRIDRIVRGLLDYARPTSSVFAFENAGDVVRLTLQMLEEQGALKKLKKSVDINNDLPAVWVDRHQLQQVLINLIINARDAMVDGGTIFIRVLSETCGAVAEPGSSKRVAMGRRKDDFGGAFVVPWHSSTLFVKIEVEDTGEGINEDNIGRIFDPFFTTKEPGHGTGLGLAISARIIDSFGGRISVESEPAKRTIFTVLLPVKKFGRRND